MYGGIGMFLVSLHTTSELMPCIYVYTFIAQCRLCLELLGRQLGISMLSSIEDAPQM